jgi:hypothetical protein
MPHAHKSLKFFSFGEAGGVLDFSVYYCPQYVPNVIILLSHMLCQRLVFFHLYIWAKVEVVYISILKIETSILGSL